MPSLLYVCRFLIPHYFARSIKDAFLIIQTNSLNMCVSPYMNESNLSFIKEYKWRKKKSRKSANLFNKELLACFNCVRKSNSFNDHSVQEVHIICTIDTKTLLGNRERGNEEAMKIITFINQHLLAQFSFTCCLQKKKK